MFDIRKIHNPRNLNLTLSLFQTDAYLPTALSGMDDIISSLKKANEDQQLEISMQKEKISALNAELDKYRAEKLRMNDLREGSDLGESSNLGKSSNQGKSRDLGKDNDLEKVGDLGMDSDLKRTKAVVECSIDGISAFLKSNEKVKSRSFTCDRRAWLVEVYKQKLDDKTYLSVDLWAAEIANYTANWSNKVAFEITLLNTDPVHNVSFGSKLLDYEFSKEKRWGWDKFIDCNELVSKGFIKNDQIKFQVDLQTKNTPDNINLLKIMFIILMAVSLVVTILSTLSQFSIRLLR